jgi:homoserine dehydrogenase
VVDSGHVPGRGDAARFRLAIVGCGTVARHLVTLLDRVRPELEARFRLAFDVTLVATRTSGIAVADDEWPGSVVRPAAAPVPSVPPTGGRPRRRPISDLPTVLADPATRYDMLVELTTAVPADGEPAATYLRSALGSGRHAVTANKPPIAWHGRDLVALAASRGVRLRCEATTMDLLPVQRLRESVLPVGSIASFAGVVNSTTNHVLTAMAAGRSGDEALREAQALGIAEADPRHDMDGHDAAMKATIIANLLLEPTEAITPAHVDRLGLEAVPGGWPAAAVSRGARVRLVARGRAIGDERRTVEVRVAPEELPLDDPLALVDGLSLGLTVDSELGGRLHVTLFEPHPAQTAYAVLVDLIALARGC